MSFMYHFDILKHNSVVLYYILTLYNICKVLLCPVLYNNIY